MYSIDKRTIPVWIREIIEIALGFGIKESICEMIIQETKEKYPDKDEDYLYDRAWSRLRPYLMNI